MASTLWCWFMTLSEWCAEYGKGAISRLARKTGLDYKTVHPFAHGAAVKTWRTAKLISEATSGAVSIEELCEPSPAVARKAS
jgi:hypothetical protein